MKKLIIKLLPIIDLVISPFVYLSAIILLAVRRAGIHKIPLCRKILFRVGVFPIINHYYEPLFNTQTLTKPLSLNRELPGIDWNEEVQIEQLNQFQYNEELTHLTTKEEEFSFNLNNGLFESGDAEYWYNIIRYLKLKKLSKWGAEILH